MHYDKKSLIGLLKHSYLGIGMAISIYGLSQFAYPNQPLLDKIEEKRLDFKHGLESIVNREFPDSESSKGKAPYAIFSLGIIIALLPESLPRRKKE